MNLGLLPVLFSLINGPSEMSVRLLLFSLTIALLKQCPGKDTVLPVC